MQLCGQGPDFALADGVFLDVDDGHDLHDDVGQEDFVCRQDVGDVKVFLDELDGFASGDLGDGSEPIPLSFSMFLDKDGSWRIYNVTAAGISLVTTYRSSYGQIIAAKGIESLIDSINDKTEG